MGQALSIRAPASLHCFFEEEMVLWETALPEISDAAAPDIKENADLSVFLQQETVNGVKYVSDHVSR